MITLYVYAPLDIFAQVVGIPVSRHFRSWLAKTLVATISDILSPSFLTPFFAIIYFLIKGVFESKKII